MTTDTIKDVLRMYYEAFNRGDFPALDHLISDDFVEHEPLPPRLAQNREGIKQYLRMLREAFPDIQLEVQDLAADKDKVWAHILMTGTQRGPFQGIPPTGNSVAMRMVEIWRFARNRVVEHWSVSDQNLMQQQMGMFPMLVSEDL
jgi:steroid delta-isomerase-like uncharacterized protein